MRVAGYVRVSRDEDNESCSSITAQKSLIEEYAQKNGWQVSQYYEDDNWSGYNFDRPGFKQLVKQIEERNIDVLIAKDLSRIGRHNALTLLFVEKLRELNIRLILPYEAGGYDTEKQDNDMLGIYTWFNEMYVKDISRKIRSSIRIKQSEGKMIIKEQFGYRKGETDKHTLLIEPAEASVVRLIFRLYLQGCGYRRIAMHLNCEGYPTPSQFIKKKIENEGQCYKGAVSDEWSSTQIQRIIKNDVYIGILRLAKTKKSTIKGKSVMTNPDEQYVFRNNHEPIIDENTFYAAQALARKRRSINYRGRRTDTNLFSGLVFCEDCGSYMIAYTKDGKKSYICGRYHKYGADYCSRHAVKEKELIDIVSEYLCLIKNSNALDYNKIHMEKNIKKQYNSLLLEGFNREREKEKEQLKCLLLQKSKDNRLGLDEKSSILLEQSYGRIIEEKLKHIVFLDKQIESLNIDGSTVYTDKETAINRIFTKGMLNKQQYEALIEKITVCSSGRVNLYLTADIDRIIELY
ncbi:MAG: recombinase family protein [Bacillota bacterium]